MLNPTGSPVNTNYQSTSGSGGIQKLFIRRPAFNSLGPHLLGHALPDLWPNVWWTIGYLSTSEAAVDDVETVGRFLQFSVARLANP